MTSRLLLYIKLEIIAKRVGVSRYIKKKLNFTFIWKQETYVL